MIRLAADEPLKNSLYPEVAPITVAPTQLARLHAHWCVTTKDVLPWRGRFETIPSPGHAESSEARRNRARQSPRLASQSATPAVCNAFSIASFAAKRRHNARPQCAAAFAIAVRLGKRARESVLAAARFANSCNFDNVLTNGNDHKRRRTCPLRLYWRARDGCRRIIGATAREAGH